METKNTNEVKKDDKKSKDNRNLVLVFMGIIIVLLLLLLLRSCGSSPVVPSNNGPQFDTSTDANATQGGLEGKSKEEIEAELNKKVAEGMINISMNLEVTFADGTSEGKLNIVNSEVNNHPQVVEIYLDDTEELIYKSGAIPVGSKVEYGKLSVDLDSGTYNCTAYFNSIDEDTGNLLGKAGAKVVIKVEG